MVQSSNNGRTDRTSVPRLAAIAALIAATPSIATCPAGYDKPTCYEAQTEVSYAFGGVPSINDLHYGDTAQTSGIPRPQAFSGAAFASTSPLHNGTLEVSTVTDSHGWHASASADLSYSFGIAPIHGGGVLPALIPIMVSALATSFRDNDQVLEVATLELTQNGVSKLNVAAPTLFGRDIIMLDIHRSINFDPSQPIHLYMSAWSDIFADGEVDRKVSRIVFDPTFIIDPAFAADYHLIGLPDGPGGVGGVPEPGMWALMIAGFGAVGSVLRSRRSRSSPLGDS